IDFAVALHVVRQLRHRFFMFSLGAEEHSHERANAVHVWMLLYDLLHHLCCCIGLSRVIKRERSERSDKRILRFTRIVELTESFVKLAHVHVNESAIETRNYVCGRIESDQSIIRTQRAAVLAVESM